MSLKIVCCLLSQRALSSELFFTKLKKSVKTGNDTTHTYYAGAIQYTKTPADQEPVLDFMMTDEGRVAFSETTEGLKGTYQYFIKDHLGNNRVLFTTETTTTVIQAAWSQKTQARKCSCSAM
ncbi:MAG: hypothetical protein JJU28_22645 [Cyclobacteriaceae bacterium]|nr:hypothetical protein [Cyclobacteriaceae bacterium]